MNSFSHPIGSLCVLILIFFEVQKLLYLMWSHLFTLAFICLVSGFSFLNKNHLASFFNVNVRMSFAYMVFYALMVSGLYQSPLTILFNLHAWCQ